ncbi:MULTISPECIES: bifunctional GNAT family N-acetyltransferase/NUDIX hydrolase [unclassified Streptomyces]|uniref:bifunctional GNAT family N-acetyltransferase/NUDIX hydrolase n=1 Tax=unclassified Streptomyces TaxID=2593676 RepID=UPI002E2C0CA0|nr:MULTISPECIES: bifunctional GNAT family N-acetyltransferase/NUDIX hydrolase [unclassified Streptomyces]WUB88083.1 bifunctional GNAT family N-acetyltransferase/NUDIX hydrolase [Streptomyces sp. NBC_00566]
MILEPVPAGGALPAPLLAELTALYASQQAFHTLSGEFPDPADIRPEQVADAVAAELAPLGAELLLARVDGRLVAVVSTLARHPDPADPDPWIGLLMVDAAQQGRGFGRRAAELTEERFRGAGRQAVRLAVLDGNSAGLAFWRTLGYETVDHRRDRELGRPCAVLRKVLLRTPRRAARTAVVAPDGAVFLFRQENVETGPHWALPGGGIEPGESPREGAVRELAEETGWTDLEPGPLLCTWEHDFTRAGVPVRQHEHVYVARGPRREPTAPALTTHGAEGILDWRWWTPAELAGTAEPVWPPGLGRLLAERAGRAGSGPRRGTI